MTDNVMEEQLKANALELRTLIGALFKAGHQAIEKRLLQQDAEMSWLQFGILMMLVHGGTQTLSELSRKLGADPSTLVPAVDALERKELILRQRDPDDRRRVPLSLTENGRALTQQIDTLADDDPILVGLRGMTAESRRELLQLLCELIRRTPESAVLLAHVRSKLAAYGAKEEHLLCTQSEE